MVEPNKDEKRTIQRTIDTHIKRTERSLNKADNQMTNLMPKKKTDTNFILWSKM